MSTPQDTEQPHDPILTVGDIRARISDLPDEARILVVVRDPRHFNRVLHDATVQRASKDTGASGPVLVLDVQGIT
jgi:hypothetical protein